MVEIYLILALTTFLLNWLLLYPSIFFELKRVAIREKNFKLSDLVNSPIRLFFLTAIPCLLTWWLILPHMLFRGISRYSEFYKNVLLGKFNAYK